MTNTTIDFFDTHAHPYDDFMSAVVPQYGMFLNLVAKSYRTRVGTGLFLDQGCGSGNLSLAILKESPASKVWLVDGSSKMVDEARQKITSYSGDSAVAGATVSDLGGEGWYSELNTSFDAIVSTFVLEHLPEPAYRNLLRKNLNLLKAGGVFISIEWSDNEHGLQDRFVEEMHAHAARHPRFAPYMADSERMERHYFVNIREKLRWLTDAGYRDLHTVGQYLNGYVVVGRK